MSTSEWICFLWAVLEARSGGVAGNVRAGCNQVTTVLCWEDVQYFIIYVSLSLFSEQGKTEVWEVNNILRITWLIKAQRDAKSTYGGFQSCFPLFLSVDWVAFKNPTPRNANMWQINERWSTAHYKWILCFRKLLAIGFFQNSTFKMNYYVSIKYDNCVAYVEM